MDAIAFAVIASHIRVRAKPGRRIQFCRRGLSGIKSKAKRQRFCSGRMDDHPR